VSFPAERTEGKETHPRRVCGAESFSWRATTRLMAPLPSDRFAILAGDETN
jgi:hypothetical protein